MGNLCITGLIPDNINENDTYFYFSKDKAKYINNIPDVDLREECVYTSNNLQSSAFNAVAFTYQFVCNNSLFLGNNLEKLGDNIKGILL